MSIGTIVHTVYLWKFCHHFSSSFLWGSLMRTKIIMFKKFFSSLFQVGILSNRRTNFGNPQDSVGVRFVNGLPYRESVNIKVTIVQCHEILWKDPYAKLVTNVWSMVQERDPHQKFIWNKSSLQHMFLRKTIAVFKKTTAVCIKTTAVCAKQLLFVQNNSCLPGKLRYLTPPTTHWLAGFRFGLAGQRPRGFPSLMQ